MSDQLSFGKFPIEKPSPEQAIFNRVLAILGSDYLDGCKVWLKNNKSSAYRSVVATSERTAYRDSTADEILFARIKANGKATYISFSVRYLMLFQKAGIAFTSTTSDKDFMRFSLDILEPDFKKAEQIREIFRKIFISIFHFSPFDCCSRYMQCSDEKRCVHPDLIYATICQYRKNLERGRIFFGANRNID